MIGGSGERWSGISVRAARHDDDDTTPETAKPGINNNVTRQREFSVTNTEVIFEVN